MNETGELLWLHEAETRSLRDVLDLPNFWFKNKQIVQPEAFFSVQLFHAVGGLDTSLFFCMDLDLWIRILRRRDQVVLVDSSIAQFRCHGKQKTSDTIATRLEVIQTGLRHLNSPGPVLSQEKRDRLIEELQRTQAYLSILQNWYRRDFLSIANLGLHYPTIFLGAVRGFLSKQLKRLLIPDTA